VVGPSWSLPSQGLPSGRDNVEENILREQTLSFSVGGEKKEEGERMKEKWKSPLFLIIKWYVRII
jgi:hypothetical protein